MPDYIYAKLPDGNYGKFDAGTSTDEIRRRVMAQYPDAFKAKQQVTQTPSIAERIGSMVPQAAVAPLEAAKRWAVDPFDKMAAKGQSAGESVADFMEPKIPADTPNWIRQTAEAERGIVRGVYGAVGSTIADPRNWPLMGSGAARPMLQRLMSRGFAAMMGKGAYDAAFDLHQNWDKYSVEQRAQVAASGGINAILASISASHGFGGQGEPSPKDSMVAPGKTESQAKAEKAQAVAPPSRTTGSEPSIQEKIAKLKADIAAAEAKAATKVEDEVEQVRRRAPEPPVEKPLENLVPPEARASKVIPREEAEALAKRIEARGAEKQALEKPLPQAPEVREQNTLDPPSRAKAQALQSLDAFRASREIQAENLRRENEELRAKTPPPAPEAAPPTTKLEEKQAEARERNAELQAIIDQRRAARDKEINALQQENAALRKTVGSQVGGQPPTPETAQPEAKPVQAAQPPSGPREPVRPAKGPSLGLEQAPSGVTKPASTKGLPSLELFRQRVEEYMKTHSGVAEGTARRVVADKMKRERGSIGEGMPKFMSDKDMYERLRSRVVEGIVYHGTNKEIADEIMKGGFKNLNFGDQVKRVLKLRGMEFSDLSEAQRDRLTVLYRSYNTENRGFSNEFPEGRVSTAIGGEVASRWAGGGGEVAKQIDEIVRGSKTKRGFGGLDYVAGLANPELRGEPAVVRAQVTDLSVRERMIRTINHLDDAIEKGEMTHKDAIETIWSDYQNFLAPASGLKPIDVITESLRARGKIVPWTPGAKEAQPAIAHYDEFIKTREGERGSLSLKPLEEKDKVKGPGFFGHLANGLDRLADLIEKRGLTDEEFQRKLQAQGILREAGANKMLVQAQTLEVLKGAIERHDNPTNQRQNYIDFHDAAEGKEGAKFLNPEDQVIAEWLRNEFADTAKDVKEINENFQPIDNYFGRLFKQDSTLNRFMSVVLRKRPFEGGKNFLRQRYYEFNSDALAHGVVPVDWNPIRTQFAALAEQRTFLFAHEVKDMYKDAGLVEHFGLGKQPEGWQQLNDKIFQPKVFKEGGLTQYGAYYAPREVAEVFNRYLSPGLGSSAVFRAIRNYGNNLNMANLGLSAYHGTFISLVAQASDLALGMQKVWNYNNVGGWRDIVRGSAGTLLMRSAAREYRFGRDIIQEALTPDTHPGLQKYVDMIVKGGGRFKPDTQYFSDLSQRKGFENWLKLAPQGKIGEMATIGIRTAAKPIMEKYVPAIKVAMASRMMEAKLADLEKNGITDENTIRNEMGKIWDSVDNRAGQMVYDNIFVNKMIKDLSFVSIRAVGWDLGSIREFGGAAMIDLPRQTAKLLRGQKPELTHRMAFTIATVVSTGILGGAMHYYLTGQAPKRLEDYFYPGPDNAKVSLPSYIKDFYSAKHDWQGTVLNKLAPQWAQLWQYHKNMDFYGTEISHPGDDPFKRGWDTLKWYGKTWLPFGATGIQKRMERGEKPLDAFTSAFGFMPAPSWITRSKAELLTDELVSRDWKQGPRSAGDAERYALTEQFTQRVANGETDKRPDQFMNDLGKALSDRRIQPSDLKKIYSAKSGESRLSRHFKELHIPDALAVMREADPNERQQLKPLLAEKYNEIGRYTEDQQVAYDKQMQAYLSQ